MTLIQPFIWLVLMGNTMSGLTSNPMAAQFLGTGNYLTFMAPGVILMTNYVYEYFFGYLNRLG
jgi:uncharacterized membrane protein